MTNQQMTRLHAISVYSQSQGQSDSWTVCT
jgi:hypothetical protein